MTSLINVAQTRFACKVKTKRIHKIYYCVSIFDVTLILRSSDPAVYIKYPHKFIKALKGA